MANRNQSRSSPAAAKRATAKARPRNRNLLLGGAVAALVVLLGVIVMTVGGGNDGESDSAGAPVPDFDLPTASGDTFNLVDHRGAVVVLNFVALGCPSCAAEMPALSVAAESFSDEDVQIVVVDLTGPQASAEQVVSYYQSVGGSDRLVYALDTSFEVAQAYGVNALGTTIVIDTAGVARFRDDVVTSAATLEDKIAEAMA